MLGTSNPSTPVAGYESTPTLHGDSFSEATTPHVGSRLHSTHSMDHYVVDRHADIEKAANRLSRKEEDEDEDQVSTACSISQYKRSTDDAAVRHESGIVKPEVDYSSKVVTWDGPSDPMKPINMPRWRKLAIVTTTGFMTFSVTFGSSVFSTTTAVTAQKFHVSSEVMLLGVSLYVLGFAFGPMLWGPISEVYGRTRPMWIGMICFTIFQIPVAVAQNLQTIFICRFLAGMFGSAPLAIVGGMFVDFLEPSDFGSATAVFAGATMMGPSLGPVVGSFITHSYLGWRWVSWITMIMSAFFTLITWLVTPETFEPVLLHWKAQKLRHETKDWALHSKSEETQIDASVMINKYLTKPIRMIIKEPILMVLTFYISLVYGLLYLTFAAYPIAFQGQRHWKPTIASLPFLAVLIGVAIACVTIAVFSATWYMKQVRIHGRPAPEARVPTMFLGSIVLPIGLFWFAWTSSPTMHWAPQVTAGIFIGAGIIFIFMSCVVYMIDVYTIHANSAMAINTFIRSAVGAAFPLFATYMYESLGVDWATSLLGFVCVALIPFPIILWYKGATIRGMSKFAVGSNK